MRKVIAVVFFSLAGFLALAVLTFVLVPQLMVAFVEGFVGEKTVLEQAAPVVVPVGEPSNAEADDPKTTTSVEALERLLETAVEQLEDQGASLDDLFPASPAGENTELAVLTLPVPDPDGAAAVSPEPVGKVDLPAVLREPAMPAADLPQDSGCSCPGPAAMPVLAQPAGPVAIAEPVSAMPQEALQVPMPAAAVRVPAAPQSVPEPPSQTAPAPTPQAVPGPILPRPAAALPEPVMLAPGEGVAAPLLRGAMGYRLPLVSRQQVPDQVVSGVLIRAHETYVILRPGYWELLAPDGGTVVPAAPVVETTAPEPRARRQWWNPGSWFRKQDNGQR